MARRTIEEKRHKRRVAHGQVAIAPARDRAPSGERPNQKALVRELFDLAWPITAAMFGETLLGLVDTKLVGGLGPAALGGVGVGTMFVFLSYGVVFGLMRAVKVATSHAVGRGEPEQGFRFAQAGLAMGAVIGVLVWIASRDVSRVLLALHVDPALVAPATSFLSAVSYGSPATCMLAALIQHRQAIGDPRSPMVVGVLGNAFNGALSYGLIYGHFGLPALGVRGGGFGTATTEWVELAAMLALFARDARRSARTETRPAIDLRRALFEVLDLGVPTGVQFGFEMLAFATLTTLLSSMGEREIAAHQIALSTIRTSFLPGIAVGEAASVMVGRALGRGDLREADRVTFWALAVASGFMAVCGVVFASFAGDLAHAFTSDEGVATVAKHLLWIAAGFQVLDAWNIVLRGALRGAKDVRVAAVLGVAIVWTCVPTAAFVLGKLLGWGAVGGWCGFIAETAIATAVFSARWRRGGWRKAYEHAAAPYSARTTFAASSSQSVLQVWPATSMSSAAVGGKVSAHSRGPASGGGA
jgi:MATE family, multidrug efflux pump